MCSGLNHKRVDEIRREKEQMAILEKRLAEAFRNDKSHTKALSENEK